MTVPYLIPGYLKANEDFIRIFSIRFIGGNPATALKEPNTAIISKSAATKYFGTKNPVGKVIRDYLMNSRERKEYRITAIVEDLPVNSHFHFDFVLAMDKSDLTDWTWYYNYIMLEDNVQPSHIIEQFNQFAEKYIEADEVKTLTPHLQKVTDIHLESSKDRELEENGNIKDPLPAWSSGLICVFCVDPEFFKSAICSISAQAEDQYLY